MITLSPENSKSITKLDALIGRTPDELANHLTRTGPRYADDRANSLTVNRQSLLFEFLQYLR
jgi:hypothetical protein